MNPVLLGVGAALLAAPLALAIKGENNLLVSVLRRLGMFGLIGLVGAGIQFLSHQPLASETPLHERALWFIQATPANAGGWIAHAFHERYISNGATIAEAPGAFATLAVGICLLLSTFMALHKDRSDDALSGLNILITGLMVINMVLGASIVWW